MALMERNVLDPRDGRPVNAHMADYLVPVNLDISELKTHFVDEVDPHVNPLVQIDGGSQTTLSSRPNQLRVEMRQPLLSRLLPRWAT
jgi:hypothetical protein